MTKPIAKFQWPFAASSLAIIQDGATNFKQPVGTGPFKFDSFVPGQNSLFLRNADYWKHPYPYVDKLTFVSIPDGTTRLNSVVAGQIDACEVLTFAQAREQETSKQIAVLQSPPGIMTPITMAVDLPPFDDVRVRQAFRLIVDRPQLVNVAQSGFGSIGNDLFGKGQEFYPADLPQREADIEQAKSLLKQAGAENLKVTLYSSTVVAGMLESANAFAQQAKEAGVTINVNNWTAGDVLLRSLSQGAVHADAMERHANLDVDELRRSLRRAVQRDPLASPGLRRDRASGGGGDRPVQGSGSLEPSATNALRRRWLPRLGVPALPRWVVAQGSGRAGECVLQPRELRLPDMVAVVGRRAAAMQ